MDIKPYKHGFEYSYTLGAFPTFELLFAAPEHAVMAVAHSTFTDMDKLTEICSQKGIALTVNDKLIAKLSDKENVFVIGIFNKFECTLMHDKPHLVMVNPGNMGNLGTIMRTAIGFGIKDMAIISPGADIFNPKTVRASMGALFRMRFAYFESFEQYRKLYGEHEIFTFMLNGKKQLTLDNLEHSPLYSLVFGNEATGLDDSYLEVGQSIIIPQTPEVDSLNLTIAAGIGMYVFTRT